MPDKVGLITGGGSGIGKATALALARAGYIIIVAGRRAELLDAVMREVGGRAIAQPTDVGDPKSVAALFSRIKAEFGRLDLLFNNAGIAPPTAPIEEITIEQWQSTVAANVTGPFLCTQAAFALMKSQTPRGGRIINNGSISAHAPRPNNAPYTTTKHAITGLTKSTSLDGRAHDIACSQIDIGNATTDHAERMSGDLLQANGMLAREPRMLVEQVAEAVVYMAGLPPTANVLFMTIMATKMPYIGRG